MSPHLLYTAEQTRRLDAETIRAAGIPGAVLMSRAAAALHRYVQRRWPRLDEARVVVGTGNNGGDGYLLAERLRRRGVDVTVYQVGDPQRIQGDAQKARAVALDAGVPCEPWRVACLRDAQGLVVDALLGTGLSGEVRPEAAAVIEEINAGSVPVLAVDIPSGLCADTGRRLGAAVHATATVTFIGRKRGLYTLDGPACAGDCVFDDLDVPAAVLRCIRRVDAWELGQLSDLLPALAPRPAASHKGAYGHVLVVGGEHGFGGAALLAAEAALRAGAGLVSVATRAAHVPAFLARRPELMVNAVDTVHDLGRLLDAASVVLIGPGLGRGPWGQQMLQAYLATGRPAVLDADALNLLAQRPAWLARVSPSAVLTPHSGEAARLLGLSASQVQTDRFGAATALQRRVGGTVVLKGNGSLVASAEGPGMLCPQGNPGMASGGMGDVLSGVIAGLMAQALASPVAARLATCAHGAAADIAAAEGQRGLLATDLMAPLRRLLG